MARPSKESILGHFAGGFLPFYGKYLPDPRKLKDNEYAALCPFHDDDQPSLNFNSQSGKFFCHGCQSKGDLFSFYASKHGLNVKNDFPGVLAGIALDFGIDNDAPGQATKKHDKTPAPWKRPIETTYDYADAGGKLIFQVVRFGDGLDPKFNQRRPGGKGKWTWNLKGVTPTLYRLPEVINAREVFVCEGEKDVDNLRVLGLVVTTSPMGSGKWRKEYSEVLRGKDAVLIPDNDDAGHKHMTDVAGSLAGLAASIKMLDLPDVGEKGDVSDWLKLQQNRIQAETEITDPKELREAISERFAMLLEGAEPYEPAQVPTVENAILEAEQFVALDLPEKRRILAPWITEQGIALISGWRGVGKTFFCMGLLGAITTGQSFGPWECVTPVPCLYLEAEMPRQDVKERLQGLHSGIDRIAPLYIYSDAHASEMGIKRANLNSETWRAQMKQFLLDREVKLWAVDNLASLTPRYDEDTKVEWDPINQWLLELRFAGITTVMAHHTNKKGGQRGTSAREDNIDISIVLKSTLDYVPEDGAKFIAHFTKARIRTSDLRDIADTQFQLAEDQGGRLVWTWGNVKRETRAEIFRMIDDGHKQVEIAEVLGVTRGYVSRIVKVGVRDGLLTDKGKLTQSGCRVVFGDENE